METITIKIANQEDEFLKIHRLNYKTFVEEIPQHKTNKEELLIDKFDAENIYFIALDDDELLGMVCIRTSRPFSLDGKLDNLDQHLPSYNHLAEIRLLSVEPSRRYSKVLLLLLNKLWAFVNQQNVDLVIISGTTRQLKLYKKLGFIPFSKMVGTEGALYQPMYLTKQRFEERWKIK